MYIYIYIHVYIFIYIHIHTHTYIMCIYIYIYIYIPHTRRRGKRRIARLGSEERRVTDATPPAWVTMRGWWMGGVTHDMVHGLRKEKLLKSVSPKNMFPKPDNQRKSLNPRNTPPSGTTRRSRAEIGRRERDWKAPPRALRPVLLVDAGRAVHVPGRVRGLGLWGSGLRLYGLGFRLMVLGFRL